MNIVIIYISILYIPILLKSQENRAKGEFYWKINTLNSLLDLNSICLENSKNNIFLPFGSGITDTFVAILHYPRNLNCSISFLTLKNTSLIIVVELFKDFNYIKCNNDKILLLHGGNSTICTENNGFSSGIYREIFNTNNVTLVFQQLNTSETLQIIVTSARYGDCKEETEIHCYIKKQIICISKALQCDKNINCGYRKLQDEDPKICDTTKFAYLWLVVTVALIMIGVVLFLIANFIRILVPPMQDNFFVFNEDEDNRLILTSQLQPLSELDPDQVKEINIIASVNSRPSSVAFSTASSATLPLQMPLETDVTRPSELELEIKTHVFKRPTYDPHKYI